MVTLALIGAGTWGQNYLHSATRLNNCVIKYICTQRQKTLNILPNKYIKNLSVDDLVKNNDIDGFIVATPGSTHFEIAKKILSLGHNLLIEKPFTINYNQALKLKKIWQKKKPQVMISHTYLYDPAYQIFKKEFKDIKKIKSILFEGLSSPIRHDVSVIWDWGPHPVSLLLNLIKQPIVEVQTVGSIKNTSSNLFDTVNASIRFANGLEASIHISWFGLHKVRKLIIEKRSGKMELDYTKTTEDALTKELIEFTGAIQGLNKITSDINFGVSVTKVLSAMEKSAQNSGRLVKLIQSVKT